MGRLSSRSDQAVDRRHGRPAPFSARSSQLAQHSEASPSFCIMSTCGYRWLSPAQLYREELAYPSFTLQTYGPTHLPTGFSRYRSTSCLIVKCSSVVCGKFRPRTVSSFCLATIVVISIRTLLIAFMHKSCPGRFYGWTGTHGIMKNTSSVCTSPDGPTVPLKALKACASAYLSDPVGLSVRTLLYTRLRNA